MWRTDLDPERRADAWRAILVGGLGVQSRAVQDAYHGLGQEALFRDRAGKGQSALFRVLHALALHLSDIGYVQSLNFVVATLIGVFPDDEALVFHCAQALLFRYSLADFYRPRFPKLGVTTWQFDRLVECFIPRVHGGLQRHGVTAEYYAVQWFLTLFASDLAQTLVRRIWDRFLLTGWEVIAQVGLALLYEVQDSLLAFDGCEVLTFLKRFARARKFEAERLLCVASGFQVTHRMLSDLEAAYASGGADEVELAAEKNLDTGHTSWRVRRRPDPVPERRLLEGEGGADDFMPQALGRPGREEKALQGNVLPFMVHNLDTGETTVMEDEWAQFVTEREEAAPRGSGGAGSPRRGQSERVAGGSFWSAGQQQQALRILGHA
ncbi:unnamed protein product [Prorocentrum cordatum]|uniref:Rab-GAP TBC domain-containing protein n=1 Tax=Prorocentrum cordatum TaxID=2364126 RepID=A0ABN9T6F8_9DINO|nr:unnamed protein product [Polarella glacialis]